MSRYRLQYGGHLVPVLVYLRHRTFFSEQSTGLGIGLGVFAFVVVLAIVIGGVYLGVCRRKLPQQENGIP